MIHADPDPKHCRGVTKNARRLDKQNALKRKKMLVTFADPALDLKKIHFNVGIKDQFVGTSLF
jgi:hypothetical protein